MKTFGKSLIVFLIFMLGALFFVHVDRQGAILAAHEPTAIQKIENFIEKQGILR